MKKDFRCFPGTGEAEFWIARSWCSRLQVDSTFRCSCTGYGISRWIVNWRAWKLIINDSERSRMSVCPQDISNDNEICMLLFRRPGNGTRGQPYSPHRNTRWKNCKNYGLDVNAYWSEQNQRPVNVRVIDTANKFNPTKINNNRSSDDTESWSTPPSDIDALVHVLIQDDSTSERLVALIKKACRQDPEARNVRKDVEEQITVKCVLNPKNIIERKHWKQEKTDGGWNRKKWIKRSDLCADRLAKYDVVTALWNALSKIMSE